MYLSIENVQNHADLNKLSQLSGPHPAQEPTGTLGVWHYTLGTLDKSECFKLVLQLQSAPKVEGVPGYGDFAPMVM